MSFSIKKSHKFTEQFSTPSNTKKPGSDFLSNEDYDLFNVDGSGSSNTLAGKTPVTKKGGNSIKPIPEARADFY